MRSLASLACLVACAVLLAACGGDDDAGASSASAAAPATVAAPATATTAVQPAAARAGGVRVKVLASRLQVPWGVAFLPDGHALISERTTGKIKELAPSGGTARTVMTVPGVARDAGEGGLLGLAVSPSYRTDHLVYAYYTTATDNRVARFRIGGKPRPILTGLRKGPIHNGGRLAFGPDGKLYIGVGETGDTGLAQDKRSLNGKILRIDPDGSIPKDNPFGNAIWSLGHRNPQGLAFDSHGRLWSSEFGQNRFDEVNLIVKGHNYGWPIVEGKGSTQGGRFTNPKVTWPTDEASPSGDAVVGSSLYVGALQGRRLYRIPIRGSSLGTPQSLLTGRFGRIRTPVRTPSGGLWFTTSNRDGRGQPVASDDRVVRVSLGG